MTFLVNLTIVVAAEVIGTKATEAKVEVEATEEEKVEAEATKVEKIEVEETGVVVTGAMEIEAVEDFQEAMRRTTVGKIEDSIVSLRRTSFTLHGQPEKVNQKSL